MKTYTNPLYSYQRPPELDARGSRRPVVVVGAGPVGLAAAIDLGQRGIPVVVLDEDHTVSVGSRAICYAKRALEILDRLDCGQRVVDKGIGWNVGKVFFRDELVYRFDLLPEPGHRRPAFVNLQQYWFEECLVDRARALDRVELRWESKVVGVAPHAEGVDVEVATPEGEYTIACDWLVVCDGSTQSGAADARAGGGGAGVPRPLPHRRHPHEIGFPDRALVLVRPAVPPQPVGAAAPAGRRRLAHRFPARLGRRSRGGEEARADHAAPARDARRQGRFRHRVGERLHVPVPADAALPARPGDLRRRRRARRLAVRRARREQRHPGRRQPGVEARARDERPRAGPAARHLRCRARPGRRREHPELDALHRLHHAEERGVADLPRRRPVAGEEVRVRAPSRQQRTALGADDTRRVPAQHAGPATPISRGGRAR